MLALKLACKYTFTRFAWYITTGSLLRENKKVLAGKLKYYTEINGAGLAGDDYRLRRNIHRLEKGLIMRPRRAVFAESFIKETVASFKAIKKSEESQNHTLLMDWASDVLVEYFKAVNHTAVIASAYSTFTAWDHSESQSELPLPTCRKKPYCRSINEPLGITVDQLEELALRRRSCRWFLDLPVPREIIEKALNVAKLAPSACNRQPFQFLIFDDPDLVQQVASIPMGTVGFSHNFPCICVLVGDLSAFPADRDRHVPYIDGSLASMGLLFALEVQGVSTCCINWPDIKEKEKEISNLLSLPEHLSVVMLIAIGFPDPSGMVPYSQKKSLSMIRQYNPT